MYPDFHLPNFWLAYAYQRKKEYDAAKYLLTAIRNSESGRKNLVEKMTSGMVSSGLHNNISFDDRRINRYLNIVRYRNGVFELVDKFRLGQ